MESEKVKEIKECFEVLNEYGETYITKDQTQRKFVEYADVLTYINELESENKDLQDLCNKTYDNLTKEIDRLEKENAELEDDLKNSIDMQKQMLDGFKTTIKEVEENIAREIPNLLKQFAERLKEKLEEYRLENEYFIKDEPNGNLWQLNASVFCIEVTQDGGLVDETLNEFLKGENNE